MTTESLGIIVFGHRRRRALDNVLKSLEMQGALSITHVWIDGYAHSSDMRAKVEEVKALSAAYPAATWRFHNGRQGIEKLMLDGLDFMIRRFERVIVLEDDCFPVENAVASFAAELDLIAGKKSVYSVYGHHFGVEGDIEYFPRFQGWGWASTREKIAPVLAQLRSMFMMSESDYLDWTKAALTPPIVGRIDVTPGRDVVQTLSRQFSWDSATTLLTAILGMTHKRSASQLVFNCGLGPDSGHFPGGVERFTRPPFAMIEEDEVWQYFRGAPPTQYRRRKFFGLDELDRKLAEYLPPHPGTFIELGASDGLNQSNTLLLERSGWRGVLIEPVRAQFELCRRNRPLAQVVHAACVGSRYPDATIELHAVGLMSLIKGARRDANEEAEWVRRGETLQGLTAASEIAPARRLSDIIRDSGLARVDLLCLDVEGYEAEVLDGLDFAAHAPGLILVEDSVNGNIGDEIARRGYSVAAVLNERTYTRDILFRKDS